MSEEITLRISFPKTGNDDLTHNFVMNKEAVSILEYAISKYSDIPASSQIYMANENHKYTYVAPEEIIGDLDLKSQHQILILPETYKMDFIYMEKNKEKAKYTINVSNESYVAEKLTYLCLKNNLFDPTYYVAYAGNKELVQDESISEQAPYAKTITFQLLPLETLYEVVIRDFLDSTLKCSLKDKQMIVMYILYVSFGPYKASQRPQYDQKIKDSVPKDNKGNSTFTKSLLKSVIDMYKQAKSKSNPMKECVDFIMGLQNFSSIVVNGFRGIVTQKRQVKPTKVTFSLNYSTLRVFKQESATLLEEYKLCDIQNAKMSNPTSLQFEYDVPQTISSITSKSKLLNRTSVNCRIEDKSDIFQVIMERIQTLTQGKDHGSSGSRARSMTGYKSVQIPAFVLGYNLFSDVPHHELNYAVVKATRSMMQKLQPQAEEFSNACEGTQKEPPTLHSLNRNVCNFVSTYNTKAATNLMKDYDDSRTSFGAFKQAAATQSLPQKDKKAAKEAAEDYETKISDFKAVNATYVKEVNDNLEELDKLVQEPTSFSVRPEFSEYLRSALFELLLYSWVNETNPCRESIDKLKKKITDLIKRATNIQTYASEPKRVLHAASGIAKLSNELEPLIEKVPAADKQIVHDLYEEMSKEVKSGEKTIKNYFKSNKPVTLIENMNTEITPREPEDPRELYRGSKDLINKLSSKRVDDLQEAVDDLGTLRSNLVSLLEMAPSKTHEPLVLAFNDFKADVERNFTSYGSNDMLPSATRCQRNINSVFTALNPADELKAQLKSFPPSDPRVKALIPIIDHLSEHGPLYPGSPTHIDIQHFIAQMPMGKTASLVELAVDIESAVPEELRKLSETCDPTKGMYQEVDEKIDVKDALERTAKSAQNAGLSAVEVRKNLRKQEREAAAKYRQLNLSLWRTVDTFNRLAVDEGSGSTGYETLTRCRDAFKTLLEESAYDMKRQKEFLPFIDEFTSKVNGIVENPHRSESLSGLASFLMLHQTRPGFYTASKALTNYNHFVLVSDSNHAAQMLLKNATNMVVFRRASLMIITLKRRFQTLLDKVDLAMKTTLKNDTKHSDVDLRADYQTFLINYTDQLFIIFSQLIVAMTTDVDALQQLSTGCDAIERLFPSIMNVETPAPYLGRAVCGIVFSSMDGLIEICNKMGAKTQHICEQAFLAVREFLFIIRRKIADSELSRSITKDGIGIADMLAVLDRDNKMMSQQTDFQRSIRKRKW